MTSKNIMDSYFFSIEVSEKPGMSKKQWKQTKHLRDMQGNHLSLSKGNIWEGMAWILAKVPGKKKKKGSSPLYGKI